MNMTHHAYFSSEGDEVAQSRTAANASLTDEQAVLAHLNVVGNLNLVINFGALADSRCT